MRAHPDLNQGPADLQSAALTIELCTRMHKIPSTRAPTLVCAPEPATSRLRAAAVAISHRSVLFADKEQKHLFLQVGHLAVPPGSWTNFCTLPDLQPLAFLETRLPQPVSLPPFRARAAVTCVRVRGKHAAGNKTLCPVVKEMDSKSIGLCPQGFKCRRCRIDVGMRSDNTRHDSDTRWIRTHTGMGTGPPRRTVPIGWGWAF